MSPKGAWRTVHSKTDWDAWEWIGGSGGGYSFEYKRSDMDGVPLWVKQVVNALDIDDRIAAAYADTCLELVGKKYIYRLVPEFVEQSCAVVTIYRREKAPRSDIPLSKSTAKGEWRIWNSKLSSNAVRREWRSKGWQQIGQMRWNRAGVGAISKWFLGGQVNDEHVPMWIQNEFKKRLNDEGAPVSHAKAPLYYELRGKKYSYRIVPVLIERDAVVADVFSRFR